MTVPPLPEQPTGGEVLRAIGRVEKSLDGLGDQVRHMDDKLDGQGLTLATTVERVSATERDIREIKAERAADRAAVAQHASSMRVGVKVAIVTAALGGTVSIVLLLIQILTHH